MKKFWDKFYEQPVDQIPWNKSQADWLEKLVKEKKIIGDVVLDVGCGVGYKSIYLAKYAGFKNVVGVDISEKAIEIAKENAKKEGVADMCSFIAHDATDLSFLPNNKLFDFVIDWAVIHCIPAEKREKYTKGISDHLKQNGLLLIRTFSTDGGDKFFIEKNNELEEKIYLLKEDDILNLYKNFKILDKNTSQPTKYKNLLFLELLLKNK